MALALDDPQQRRLGIATDRGLHQIVQGLQKPRLHHDGRVAAPAAPPDSLAVLNRAAAQILQPAADRAARDAGCLQDSRNSSATCRARFAGRQQTPIPLAKKWRERIESSCYPCGVDHAPKVVYAAPASPCIPDSFVAFSPPHRVFSSDSVVQARALITKFCRARKHASAQKHTCAKTPPSGRAMTEGKPES